MQSFIVYFILTIVISNLHSAVPLNLCCPPGTIYEDNYCAGVAQSNWNLTFKNYTLDSYLPNCMEDQELVKIDASEIFTQDDMDYEYIDQSAITDSGYFRYNESYYAPRQFCILSLPSADENEVEILICKPTCSENMTCVPKCCLLHEVLQVNGTIQTGLTQACVPVKSSGKVWTPTIYRHEQIPFGSGNQSFPVNIQYAGVTEWNLTQCHNLAFYPYKGALRFDFRLLPSGEVMLRSWNPKWEKLHGKFCLDGNGGLNGEYSGYENDTVLINCYPHEQVSRGTDYALSRSYYSIMLVSAFFLFLTIIIYGLLWEKHTIHGFSLLSYFVAIFIMQLTFVSVFILSEKSVFEGTNMRINRTCFAFAIFSHFAYLHSFTWMTVVKFDLWCTFRTLKSSLTTSKGRGRYLKYLGFAVGVPVVIVTIAIFLDLTYGDLMPYERDLIIPDYGKRKCYVSNPDARLPYIIGPVTLFLLLNIFFFISTICALRHASDGSRVARGSAPTSRQSVTLIAKLICIMGIPWIFEAISSDETLTSNKDAGRNIVPWYWVVLDLLNQSQGIIIFIFFVCKPDIIKSLRTKFPAINSACHSLSRCCPCLTSKTCGSANATMLTLDSENDVGHGNRGHTLEKDKGNTKQSTSQISRHIRNTHLNEPLLNETTKV